MTVCYWNANYNTEVWEFPWLKIGSLCSLREWLLIFLCFPAFQKWHSSVIFRKVGNIPHFSSCLYFVLTWRFRLLVTWFLKSGGPKSRQTNEKPLDIWFLQRLIPVKGLWFLSWSQFIITFLHVRTSVKSNLPVADTLTAGHLKQ